MNDLLILAAVFLAVMILSMSVVGWLSARAELGSRVEEASGTARMQGISLTQRDLAGFSTADHDMISNYFEVVRGTNDPNSLRSRLIRAGYFSKSAVPVFQVLRFTVAVLVLAGSFFAIGYLLPDKSRLIILLMAMIASGFSFFVMNLLLERRGMKREREYQKLFPDFMDMLIVCADAGLSIEAAVDRVAKEFLASHKSFGIHLSIMMLEVRGGRRLRDALANFAQRVQIDEARSLAVLLRQSEELGSSITKTLRVYSREMRQMRMIRAEEKANTLPVKMLFPLALFLFPMSILIVLVPIVIKVVMLISSLKA
ncbi:type II secretion system F family protein [Roseibium salinum]|uniref:Type II secretion system F family protein n=1 Tax=Roseibium salinum TaxID=1604349 RepID=A0ABT3R9F2_9HYPH|nr:type II secretion system F family protein [Roseibium sp. DSM 29163]MCX2725660.1 type II secretion system F family protein [Roseibium sp. DSM 29163]